VNPRRRKPIVENVEYSASFSGGEVALVVRRHRVEFVEETIPDGQMAGMTGHRPVPCVDEFEFRMGVRQARALAGDLAEALVVADDVAERGRLG
jgi:hypothetical protein